MLQGILQGVIKYLKFSKFIIRQDFLIIFVGLVLVQLMFLFIGIWDWIDLIVSPIIFLLSYTITCYLFYSKELGNRK